MKRITSAHRAKAHHAQHRAGEHRADEQRAGVELVDDAVDDDDERAVGPPICTREPLKAAMIPPPMMAVSRPCSGFTPDAMAKAIDSGNARIMTFTPAKKSRRNWAAV